MDFDRHCTEIRTQTELLTTGVSGADLRSPVPSCPGWSLGDLVRHVGEGQRWAEEIVRTRAPEFRPDQKMRKLDGDDSGPLPIAWLTEGATRLADTLREAGPDAELWAPFDYHTPAFWARRFTHETLMHRADATLAAGTPFEVESEVALDAVDEWLELDALPQHFDLTPDKRSILGPDRTIALVATDVAVEWFVDFTGDVITWRRGRAAVAVTMSATLTDLLLTIYRRKAVHDNGIDTNGDADLLDLWLRHGAFE